MKGQLGSLPRTASIQPLPAQPATLLHQGSVQADDGKNPFSCAIVPFLICIFVTGRWSGKRKGWGGKLPPDQATEVRREGEGENRS